MQDNDNQNAPKSNVPEFSVAELAFSLKKTLEENYGRVRVKGELSRVSIAGSGHMYSSLKDDDAVIDAVCWKGNLAKLSVKPEEGLEVICIGKISSYPKSSKYQLVIESMELAGEGALLKMLEERRKKLTTEGLFDQDRKKQLPFLPQTIGVVTSPTGAVIRDILHRLADRMPSHVLVWPVLVQGDGAASQITDAINGFNALTPGSQIPKPDLLIVARGGGSLEDLMAFNEENVVRAAAASDIPIISAIGHETDTTLIDYAADLRAPTPTGAAEMAVPVRANLVAQLLDDEQRLINAAQRLLTEARQRLETNAKGLGDPTQLLTIKTQTLDHIADKLTGTFTSFLSNKREKLLRQSGKLQSPKQTLQNAQTRLDRWSEQLKDTSPKITEGRIEKISHLEQMLEAYSFKKTLARGYAVIRTKQGRPVTNAETAKTQNELDIEFKDSKIISVIQHKSGITKKQKTPKKEASENKQSSLF